MWRFWVIWFAMVVGSPAWAQTLYLPVQYQFGRYGEIFYGGTDPWFVSNPYLFMPEVPRNAPLLPVLEARAGIYPYSPAVYPQTVRFGFPSAAYRPGRYDVREPQRLPPILFSDTAPGVEVGQLGFTADDARNEAYFNAPRYYPPVGAAVVERELPRAAGGSNRARAIPLLNWARAAHAKGDNPQLVSALLHEAAKYDPQATAELRSQWGR